MFDSHNLRTWLSGDSRVSVIQDGTPVACASIASLADDLAQRLRPGTTGRIALATHRVDRIYAALSACQSAGRQLLLLRETYPPDSPVWAQWKVDTLLDDKLAETILAPADGATGQIGVLLMTSGTTGVPKVVLHDLDRLLGRIRPQEVTPAIPRWLLTYHPASFAGLQVLLTALFSRGELIATNRPTMTLLTEAALQHQPTHVSGTPTFWRSFLLAVGPQTTSLPLQQITLGGEAVDQHTLDQLRAAFPAARLSHIYASTEAGALFAVKDGRAGFPARWLQEGVEGVQLRICDGVLEVLSPRSMRSYFGAGQRPEAAADGWILTGDLVEIVGDRVIFRGRLDDLINVGGAKVMPEQVESALLNLPFIREARVYGVRNPLTGALVAADIVLAEAKPEETARREIVQHLGASLENYKLPRIIQFVSAIHTNATGKKVRNP